MYPENPEGTQVIVGSMNMGYISDTARNRTHNLFRPKRKLITITNNNDTNDDHDDDDNDDDDNDGWFSKKYIFFQIPLLTNGTEWFRSIDPNMTPGRMEGTKKIQIYNLYLHH